MSIEYDDNFEYNHPCYVPAYRLLGDLFLNIMGNAIKHSNPQKPLMNDETSMRYCFLICADYLFIF